MILFLRSRKLGRGSTAGMSEWLNTQGISSYPVLHESASSTLSLVSTTLGDGGLIVRWGCVASLPPQLRHWSVLNKSESIHRVNNKRAFRLLIQQTDQSLCPSTITELGGTNLIQWPLILRPATHAQGRNLWLVNGMEELLNVVSQRPVVFANGWYASEFIDKVAEYRVYVVNGRVATVARKTPADPSAVAWNVAQGGRFDVVPYSQWHIPACEVAIKAFSYSGLDFSGVDVMVDRDGRAYVIELNSAPSLPHLSDGSVSYRQTIMAKCFKYIHENGTELEPAVFNNGWRGVIHPAVRNEDA